jgi:lysophospholipase L1-like esterase
MIKLTLHGVLFAVAALFAAYLAFDFVRDDGYTLDQQFGEASIAFRTDRVTLLSVGGCVEVTWRVEGIRAVYLNGVPAIGEGAATHCTTGRAAPTLRVTFQDGRDAEFIAPIRFWIEQPGTLVGAAGVLALLIGGVLVWATARFGGNASTAAGRRTSLLMRGLAAFGGAVGFVIVLALVLEVGLRLLFTFAGDEAQRIAYLYTREEINARSPATTLPLPGVDYLLSPTRQGFNSLGYRGAPIAVPKPPGVFRIIVLGASEVYGFTPADQTFPAQLQRILRDDYGYGQVEVINGGIIGYTSWQVFTSFALHAVEIEPDLAIVYMGGNDVDRREIAPDCYRGVNPLRGLDPAARVSTDAAFAPLPPSALYRFIAIQTGLMPDPGDIESRSFVVDVGCERSGGLPDARVAANPPVYFERHLRYLLAIGQSAGIPVVLSTWAYREDAPEARPYWREAVAEHNSLIRRVAEESGAPFIDYAPIAPQDAAAWSDYRHPNADGSRRWAEVFAAWLHEEGLIR